MLYLNLMQAQHDVSTMDIKDNYNTIIQENY